MISTICAVKDRATDAFGRPIFVPTAAAGIRTFQDEINRADPNNAFHSHPDDYDLFDLGTFDDNTGHFDLHDLPQLLMLGKNAIR
jgi:hypothetical protein